MKSIVEFVSCYLRVMVSWLFSIGWLFKIDFLVNDNYKKW